MLKLFAHPLLLESHCCHSMFVSLSFTPSYITVFNFLVPLSLTNCVGVVWKIKENYWKNFNKNYHCKICIYKVCFSLLPSFFFFFLGDSQCSLGYSGTQYAAQNGLKIVIVLSQPPEYRDYRHVPPHQAL
jgi:hypothetical protein